ncbi:tripartite tricarboxylate transporter TctB family protein [Xanthobacteraceae bacterium Astr-EGSB]|uniref:tripartite tricarboxylate transporter TctB family protein n=1 Tax=Astrobacterium formosum TaxID=3069710 RepID=UPI0027AF21E2|nr:tripartite tricarboxylate transporter TctB family protein [Xanthobacteraceae bacterium Astr-EGSB]
MRRFSTDAIIALVLLVVCAELYRETFNFRAVAFATMSPAVWPRFVILLLAAFCVALLGKEVFAIAGGVQGGRAAPPISHRTAAICFGLFAIFLIVTPWLGMLIAGLLYVFIMQEVLGPRDIKSRFVHLAIAAVSVGGMWAVFTFALRVILPQGELLRM